MRLSIWSFGKKNRTPDAYDLLRMDYLARLHHFVSVQERLFAPVYAHGLSDIEIQKKEMHIVVEALSGLRAQIIVLDERGKHYTSQAFAQKLHTAEVQAVEQLIFLIGGARGWHADMRAQDYALWSLSPLTFPHAMARVVLAEQLYRAYTILRAVPYHY